MKAVVAAFNQEKALVGAFSVIVQLHRLIVFSTSPGGEPISARWMPGANLIKTKRMSWRPADIQISLIAI